MLVVYYFVKYQILNNYSIVYAQFVSILGTDIIIILYLICTKCRNMDKKIIHRKEYIINQELILPSVKSNIYERFTSYVPRT